MFGTVFNLHIFHMGRPSVPTTVTSTGMPDGPTGTDAVNLSPFSWNPTPMTKRYYEDIAVGETHEYGPKTLSREEIIDFARKYDPLPFHLDDVPEGASVFEGVVASGIHTIAICQRLMADTFYTNTTVMGGPGIKKAQMMNPVYPGDELAVTAEVLDKRPLESRPELGMVELEQTVANQHGEPVLEMVMTPFFKRR